MKNKKEQLFNEIKEDLLKNHTLYSDRAMAFYQGAMWVLASLEPQLTMDYLHLANIDERCK